MNLTWEIDDANVVSAKVGGFGRKMSLRVNGIDVPCPLTFRKKCEFPFELSDGRSAVILIDPQIGSRPLVRLLVENQLMVESGSGPFTCTSCKSTVRPNDRFCGACGHPMPPAEKYLHLRYVKEATRAISLLAILFLVFGIIMYFGTKAQVAGALDKLKSMSPAEVFPKPINGVKYTVAELRKQLTWEPWSVLISNLVLATIMAVLALWGKRSPLAAVLIATAIYAVVLVTNAILNPATIFQGIYLKVLTVVLLTRGIKAALALRTAYE